MNGKYDAELSKLIHTLRWYFDNRKGNEEQWHELLDLGYTGLRTLELIGPNNGDKE